MLSDLRIVLRSLIKSPGFALVAVLTLALGVGANTAIFSVIHAVLLHPFPYTDSDRLLMIQSAQQGQQGSMPVTYPDYLDWRANSRSFEDLAFVSGRSFTLTRIAEPASVRGSPISASMWSLLGVQPILGRTFTAEEDQPAADPVCVLSYALWQGRFGGELGIVGRTITLDSKTYTVIGVMPPRFKLWAGDLWLPVGLEANTELMHSRVLRFDSSVLGKPKRGLSIAQAEAELNVVASHIAEQHPDSNKGLGVKAALLSEMVTGNFRRPLYVLMGAVGCVLLIACANVANLLLARSATRQREYAIRTALGATRIQLMRQIILESVPLAVLGGLAGLLFGTWGLQALLVILPPDSVPAEAQISVNPTVMLTSLAFVLLTMLVFSLFPAFEGSRPPANEALQDGSRGTSSARSGKIRAGLIIAEITLSVTLLVGAGLLIRSLARLYFVDPGFEAKNLFVAQVQLPEARYPTGQKATEFFTQLVHNARQLPGVKAAGATSNPPFAGGMGIPLITKGRTYNSLNDLQSVQFGLVPGDYFTAQGMRLVKGRTFDNNDRAGSAPVIILNEAAVKQYLPEGDPIGQQVMLGVPENLITPGLLPPGLDKFQWATVVGVVRNTRHFGLQADPPPAAYIPVDQSWTVPTLRAQMAIILRTDGDPMQVARGFRQMLAQIDRDQPIGRLSSMESLIGESLRQSRFNTILLGIFAAIALALAIVGIYGIVAWNVTQRTREFGIRQALGAEGSDVLRLVLRQGMRLVFFGLLVGLGGALAVARTLQSMLFEIGAFDLWTFSLVALLLASVALLACIIPALRATRVDPVVALRAE